MNLSGISSSSILGRSLRLPLRLLPRNMRVPVLQGPMRGTKWTVGSSDHGCWLGSYEFEKQNRIACMLRPGATFYDVGAHVGFYTLLAAKLLGPQGRVVAFEPFPRNLDFLQRHVSINGCDNVSVIAAAVSEREGTAKFQVGPSAAMGGLNATGDLAVRTVSLDTLFQSGSLPKPDFIKMDIEGGELLALRGGQEVIRSARPVIFLATHGQQVHRACCDLLKAWGCSLSSIGTSAVEATDELIATWPKRD